MVVCSCPFPSELRRGALKRRRSAGCLSRSTMMAHRGPDAVDKLVGRNIRVLRLAKGLSQTELADALGVTFQQVQKYEKGTNRVGSGRLLKISGILGSEDYRFLRRDRSASRYGAALSIRSAGAARVLPTGAGVFRDRSPEYPPDTGAPDRADCRRAIAAGCCSVRARILPSDVQCRFRAARHSASPAASR